jgi:cation diffusion facilitator family transporter
VGLLSDALEGLVNLAAAVLALVSLTVAARPPDDDHAFGHDKAEYFAAGLEGALVLLAALGIVIAAAPRLLAPRALTEPALGLAVSALAAGINLTVALVLRRAGTRHRSPTLTADAAHLLTDVYSSAAVIGGVALVAATGWNVLDPLLALFVGGVVIRTGTRLVSGAAQGLMDRVFDPVEHAAVVAVLDRHRAAGLDYHALRTRQAGVRRFLSVHVLVPPEWTVQRAHDEAEEIEAELRAAVPGLSVLTHLEPLGDPAADADIALDRG